MTSNQPILVDLLGDIESICQAALLSENGFVHTRYNDENFSSKLQQLLIDDASGDKSVNQEVVGGRKRLVSNLEDLMNTANECFSSRQQGLGFNVLLNTLVDIILDILGAANRNTDNVVDPKVFQLLKSENSTLQENLKSIEASQSTLIGQIESKELELKQLREKVKSAADQKELLVEELEQKNEELKESEERISDLQQELSEVQDRVLTELVTSKQSKKEAEQRLVELEKELESIRSQSHEISMSTHGHKADLIAAEHAKDAAILRANELERTLGDTKDLLASRDKNIIDLRDQLDEACRMREGADTKCAQLEKELHGLDAAEAGLVSAQQAKLRAESRAAQLEAAVNALKREKAEMEERVRRADESLRLQASTVSAAVEARDMVVREKKVMEAELMATNNATGMLKEKLQQLEMKVENATAVQEQLVIANKIATEAELNLISTKRELEAVRNAEINAHKRAQDLQKLVTSLEDELKEATRDDAISAISQHLATAQHEKAVVEANMSELESVVAAIKAERHEAAMSALSLKGELDMSRHTIDSLQSRLQELLDTAAKADTGTKATKAAADDAVAQLTAQLNEAKIQLATSDELNQSLQKRIAELEALNAAGTTTSIVSTSEAEGRADAHGASGHDAAAELHSKVTPNTGAVRLTVKTDLGESKKPAKNTPKLMPKMAPKIQPKSSVGHPVGGWGSAADAFEFDYVGHNDHHHETMPLSTEKSVKTIAAVDELRKHCEELEKQLQAEKEGHQVRLNAAVAAARAEEVAKAAAGSKAASPAKAVGFQLNQEVWEVVQDDWSDEDDKDEEKGHQYRGGRGGGGADHHNRSTSSWSGEVLERKPSKKEVLKERDELSKQNDFLVDRSIDLQDQVETLLATVAKLTQQNSNNSLSSPTSPAPVYNKAHSTSTKKENSLAADHLSTPIKMANNGRQFFIDDKVPIALIEVGSFQTRVGMWHQEKQQFEIKYTCRTCTAVAINDSYRYEVVRFASSHSDPMFQRFRDEGMFVGGDAYHCCFDHPDRGLRGSLKLMPILQDGCIKDSTAFEQLLDDCLARGMMMSDASALQLLISYKLSYGPSELQSLAQALFERLACNKVCLLNEAALVASSVNIPSKSLLVVDIGAARTSVYPIYEGFPLKDAIRHTNVGGEHITDLLTLLLYSQNLDSYSTLLPRRCREVARQVKEKCAFVSLSFDQATSYYGSFEFEVVPTLLQDSKLYEKPSIKSEKLELPLLEGQPSPASIQLSQVQSKRTEKAKEIRLPVDIRLPDGTVIPFVMDVERFHCSEVLLNPTLFEDCKTERSVVDTIVAAINAVDELAREEVCAHVLLGGGSSVIPGLQQRLQRDLRQVTGNASLTVLTTVQASQCLPTGVEATTTSLNQSAWLDAGSSVIQGASNCVRKSLDPHLNEPIESQNFITTLDYDAKGLSLLGHLI